MTRVHLKSYYFDFSIFWVLNVTCKCGRLMLPIFLPFGYERACRIRNGKFSEFKYILFKWTLMTRTDDLLEINWFARVMPSSAYSLAPLTLAWADPLWYNFISVQGVKMNSEQFGILFETPCHFYLLTAETFELVEDAHAVWYDFFLDKI